MRPEEQLQRSVVDLLAIYQNRGLLAFAHVPNGGSRARRPPGTDGKRRRSAEAGILKAMGVQAGVPDVLIWAAGGRGFGVELKTGRGALSGAQVVWHSTLASLGHRVYVCRSVDEVEAVLRAEGVPAVGKLATVITADVPEWAR
jgi:hypothetical protein